MVPLGVLRGEGEVGGLSTMDCLHCAAMPSCLQGNDLAEGQVFELPNCICLVTLVACEKSAQGRASILPTITPGTCRQTSHSQRGLRGLATIAAHHPDIHNLDRPLYPTPDLSNLASHFSPGPTPVQARLASLYGSLVP